MSDREELMQLHVVADESQAGHETFVMQAPASQSNADRMLERMRELFLESPDDYQGTVQLVFEDSPRFLWSAEGGTDG